MKKLSCPKCSLELPETSVGTTLPSSCPRCRQMIAGDTRADYESLSAQLESITIAASPSNVSQMKGKLGRFGSYVLQEPLAAQPVATGVR